jgi:hypothetical protein
MGCVRENVLNEGERPQYERSPQKKIPVWMRIVIEMGVRLNTRSLCGCPVFLNSLTEGAKGGKDCGVIRIIGP